jgi:hypothetical protein
MTLDDKLIKLAHNIIYHFEKIKKAASYCFSQLTCNYIESAENIFYIASRKNIDICLSDLLKC